MMRLAVVFDRTRDDTTGMYFLRACQELGIQYDHIWMRDAARVTGSYDLYVRIDHGDYGADLPDRLRPRVFYAIDTHLPKSWKRIRQVASRYDLVCCAQRRGAEALHNGVWVPLGWDPGFHAARSGAEKRWDVAFVGTDGGVPRKFYVQLLRERYPRSRIGHAPHTELGAIYGAAKIGFNYSIRDDVNMRMFEIVGAGALLVTNRLSHDDFERLGLYEGEQYVGYRDARELCATIDTYLKQDTRREAIAKAGAQAARRHTYRHRLQQLLTAVDERLGQRWTDHWPVGEASSCVSS